MNLSPGQILENMTPSEALDRLVEGNKRFASNRLAGHNQVNLVEKTANGQYPFAAILGCIDSRAPAEILFDQGIGDLFNVRIAGNIVNNDVLGSLEYACGVVGSKLIVVMGHTSCGAVISALNNVELGNITALLARIRPAVDAVPDAGNRPDEVARMNVLNSMEQIRRESPLLAAMEAKGDIMIRGAVYNVSTGRVTWLD